MLGYVRCYMEDCLATSKMECSGTGHNNWNVSNVTSQVKSSIVVRASIEFWESAINRTLAYVASLMEC